MASWLPTAIFGHLGNGGPRNDTARRFFESAPLPFTLSRVVAGPVSLRPLIPVINGVAFMFEGHSHLGPFRIRTGCRVDVFQQGS